MYIHINLCIFIFCHSVDRISGTKGVTQLKSLFRPNSLITRQRLKLENKKYNKLRKKSDQQKNIQIETKQLFHKTPKKKQTNKKLTSRKISLTPNKK